MNFCWKIRKSNLFSDLKNSNPKDRDSIIIADASKLH
jgi:hypothetical protein